MMRSVVVFLILLFGGARSSDAREREPDCGLKSVYLAMRSLGHSATWDEFREQHLPVPAIGYSLAELKQMAETEGYQCRLVRTSADRLDARSRASHFACVAWLERGHFVLINDVSEDGYHIVDPPRTYRVAAPLFATKWTGEALLVSDRELAEESSFARGSFSPWWPSLVLIGILAASVFFILKRAK